MARRGEFGRLADVLIPFLVTRQIICGPGAVAQTPRGAVYGLSRRAGHNASGLSPAATRSRPLINTRDEARAAAAGLRRLRVMVSERYRAEHGPPLAAPQVARADLAYHDVHRGRGLYYQLQRSGVVERTARDIDILEAKTVPPAPSRYRQAG